MGAALAGREIGSIETPHPRHALERWPQRLAGRGVRSVDARGKHLFIRFEGDLTLHSHLRMTGQVGRVPARRALAPRAAAGLAGDPDRRPRGGRVRRTGARADDRLAHPLRPPARRSSAPTCSAPEFDEARFLSRLRADDQSRGLGDALLDQRNVAGIGNKWKAEGCFLAGLDPWRRLSEVTDDEALAVVRGLRR